jgi:hypothetical protein
MWSHAGRSRDCQSHLRLLSFQEERERWKKKCKETCSECGQGPQQVD